MTSEKVLTKYEHLLEKQIDRLKKEFVENEAFDPNCPVCKGDEDISHTNFGKCQLCPPSL